MVSTKQLNEVSDETLIELAKKAKPVPVGKVLPTDEGAITIHNFLRELDIKPGRNNFDSELLYDAYVEYTSEPLSNDYFSKHMNKIFKTNSDGTSYRVNLLPMTLLNRMKEKQHEEENSKEEVSEIRKE